MLDFFRRLEAAQGTRTYDSVLDLIHPEELFRFNVGDLRGIEAIRGLPSIS